MYVGRPKGFTLIEMLIVVAVLGIGVGIAANAMRRSNSRAVSKNALQGLKGRLEVARSLAMSAGSRLGTAGFVNCVNGIGPLGTQLAIVVDPVTNTYQVPTRLSYAGGGVATGATIDSTCTSFNIASEAEGRVASSVTVNGAGAPVTFGFTATGRLDPALNAGPIFIRVVLLNESPTEINTYPGIRILPSGVICSATNVAGAGCDEDAPP